MNSYFAKKVLVASKFLNSKTQKVFISSGFAEVTGERCTILATESEDVTNIDASEIEQMIDAASAFKEE